MTGTAAASEQEMTGTAAEASEQHDPGVKVVKGPGWAPKDKTEPPPELAFAVALREQLRDMASEPLTVRSARQISMFAQSASKLMKIVGKGPLPTKKRRPGFIGVGGYSDMTAEWDDEENTGTGAVSIPYIGNPAETFGSSVVRQAIEVWKEMEEAKRRSPVALIRAISEARKAGLNDIADEMARQLRKLTGVESKDDPPTAEILQVDSKADGSGEPQITEAHVPAAVAAAGELIDQLQDMNPDDMTGLGEATPVETL